MTMRRRILPAAAAMLLAGCGFFSRPKNQFFSLETVPAETRVAKSGPPAGIEGIELPPGLDRRGIYLRDENNKVEVRGTHQWTAPLEEMVIHTLAFDLANRLPEGMVILPGQAKPSKPMRSIYVIFEELAAGPDPVFVLDARWTLGEVTRHEVIRIDLQSMESPAIADAMSRALGALADRIAAAL